jgi:hypothetical protein
MMNRRQLFALLPLLGALPLIGKLKPKGTECYPYWVIPEGTGCPPYWAEVKRLESELRADFPGFTECTITSIENKRMGMVGGQSFKCVFWNAAMRIADGTHRLSTEVEVLEFRADELEHAEWLASTSRRRAAVWVGRSAAA